jgi:predicted nuclease of predicted toxin-antitoxin system
VTPSAQPVFFVDWCFGKTVVNALREAGALIEHHGDHFKQNAPDTEWLPVVGDRGWVVLTKDKAIAKNQLELMAIARSEVKVFSLTPRNLSLRRLDEYYHVIETNPDAVIFWSQVNKVIASP